MYDTAQPYIASFILLRRKGKIAFVLRSNTGWMNGYYGLPSGKVEKAESFSSAAVREAAEEVGINVTTDNLKFVHVLHRYTGEEASEWIDVFFEPMEFDGEPYNAEPHMHDELAWLDPKDLPENVIPAVKFALEQIEQGKKYSEFGWSKKA